MSHVWNQTGECYLVACSFIAGDQVCYWAYHTTSSLQQCEKWLPLPSFALRVPIYLLYLSFPFAPTYLVTFWVMSVYPFFCVSMAISSPFSLSPIVPIYVRKWECQGCGAAPPSSSEVRSWCEPVSCTNPRLTLSLSTNLVVAEVCAQPQFLLWVVKWCCDSDMAYAKTTKLLCDYFNITIVSNTFWRLSFHLYMILVPTCTSHPSAFFLELKTQTFY